MCGINAAQGRVRTVADSDVLLVRRFNRKTRTTTRTLGSAP